MTCGPYGPWPTQPDDIETIDQAYEVLRAACNRLEILLERDQERIDHKTFKRCDKAVVVMKAGFKIMKKATTYKKRTLRVVA
jgi:hypothetical protein